MEINTPESRGRDDEERARDSRGAVAPRRRQCARDRHGQRIQHVGYSRRSSSPTERPSRRSIRFRCIHLPGPGYGGAGLEAVRKAGLVDRHTWIEKLDYLALPKLAEEGKRFDFIFIDGYHSFDYAMIDFFFADLLLQPGGMVLFHDSGSVAVHRVCQFVAANKSYAPVGPPLALILDSLPKRVARRAYWLASGQDGKFKDRRERWKSLAAFVKNADGMTKEFVLKGF